LLRRAGWEGPVLSGAVLPLKGRTPNAEPSSYLTVAPDDLTVARPEEDAARVTAIAEAMLAVPERFHLVTIGAMTNAAKLVQQHPEVRERWQSVPHGGGWRGGRSGTSCDVEAKVVLRELHLRWWGWMVATRCRGRRARFRRSGLISAEASVTGATRGAADAVRPIRWCRWSAIFLTRSRRVLVEEGGCG
jgi:hypothetical protein